MGNSLLSPLSWPPFFAATMLALAPSPAAEKPSLFSEGRVWRIKLEITDAGTDSLRRTPRQYVAATLREGGRQFPDVGVRVKGSKGSFRSIDDKPSLTINCDFFNDQQTFYQLRKFQLNNSVEDPSYLHEKVGSEFFRAAGVPTPRLTHAWVELNGRTLGLYVLKEGFASEFLQEHFRATQGNLYEADDAGGYDIDQPMKRNSGDGPSDRSDLHQLLAAAQEPDLSARWARLQQVLSVDSFITFMAMEVLSGHRDGYCLARNNFRVYHDPTSKRLVFLPDGMDQLFGRADAPIYPRMEGLLAQAVMEIPAGRKAYTQRLTNLVAKFLAADSMTNQVHPWAVALAAELPRKDGRALTQEAAALAERMARRLASVQHQLSLPEVTPLRFVDNVAEIDGWQPVDSPTQGKMEQTTEANGKIVFAIIAGPQTAASWRTTRRLSEGLYRMEVDCRTVEVQSLGFGQNNGAFLGVTGRAVTGRQHLLGNAGWTSLGVEFRVTEAEANIELGCFLRASSGQAQFRSHRLRHLFAATTD